jgi:hypothetical protein
MDDPVLTDGLLIFGFLVIVLAPMSLALAYMGGAGWKLLTFLCCVFAAWSFFRPRFGHRDCGVGPSVGVRDDGRMVSIEKGHSNGGREASTTFIFSAASFC